MKQTHFNLENKVILLVIMDGEKYYYLAMKNVLLIKENHINGDCFLY